MHVIYSVFQISMDRKKAFDLSEQGGVDKDESVVTLPVRVDASGSVEGYECSVAGSLDQGGSFEGREGVGVSTIHGGRLSHGDGGVSAAAEATVHVHAEGSVHDGSQGGVAETVFEERNLLLAMLPEGYNYLFLNYCLDQNNLEEIKYSLEVRVNVPDPASVKVFLSEFNESTSCTFNLQSGKPDRVSEAESKRCRYSGYRKCCMKVVGSGKKELQPGKNTNCPAKLMFKLENAVASKAEQRKIKEDFPLWIKVEFDHNHAINRAEFLKFRSVSEGTKSAFEKMFKQGLTPSTAHAEMRRMIRAEFPENWPEKFADRSILPSIFWSFYWHRLWTDKTIGSRDGVDAYEKAIEMVKEFDTMCKAEFPLPEKESYARIAQTDSGETVVAIVDPFMRRVHQIIPQAGDLVLIDATSNLDRNDTKLVHLVCPSVIGGLPVGEILTTREDTDTLRFGLDLLKTVLPGDAFYGRGVETGPQLFMTDDSDSLRNALNGAWGHAELLLCTFHILQAQWNWLWDARHGVPKQDRPVLLRLFRDVLYAECEEELSNKLELLYADPVYNRHPQYQEHLDKDTFPKMEAWSLAHRIMKKLPTSNNNTNNYVECSFRYTKEDQFNRHKAYNLPDLLSILLDRSEFYANKCVDAGNNVLESWLKNCNSKYVKQLPDINPDTIVQVGPLSFLVPSETNPDTSYLVDMEMRHCSCPQGQLKGPCKHKQIVSVSKSLPSFDVIPTKSPQMRRIFMYLGTGKTMGMTWFLPLQAEPASPLHDTEIAVDSLHTTPVAVPDSASLPGVSDSPVTPLEVVSTDQVKERLQAVMSKLHDKLAARIDHDPTGYDKALAVLEKSVQKLPSNIDSALQKSLYSFGKSVTEACSVKKRKRIGLIPVQSTSKSRRLYKLRGSRSAVQGRPRLDTRLAVQLAVGDDSETEGGVVRHKLPSRRKRTHAGGEHSLDSAVRANRKASKKH